MFKTLTNVIKVCIGCFVVCVIVSVVFEIVEFQHSRLLQEFSIGAACSFIVVVISTWVQYRMELKKALSYHISVTWNLLFIIALYSNYQGMPSKDKDRIEREYTQINNAFAEFRESQSEIFFITKKMTEKHFHIDDELNKMYTNFVYKMFISHEEAVQVVTNKDIIIRVINTYLEHWPDCFEKTNIRLVKEWLTEKEQPQKSQKEL